MTEPSPYQPPEASLNQNFRLPNQNLIIRQAASTRGAVWFFDGFKRLFKSPGTWIGIGFINIIIVLVLAIVSLIPVIGSFLSYLFYPVLVAGFMYACYMQDQDKIQVADFFKGFSQQTGQLFLCGAMYIVMMIGVLVVVMILAFAIVVPMFSEIESAAQSNPMELVLFAALFVLLFIGLTLPIIMAIWFAPALIMLNDQEAIPAIKLSFIACSKNVVPYLIYSIVAIVIYTAVGLAVFFAVHLGSNGDIPGVFTFLGVVLGVFLLVIGAPAVFISIYSAYLEVFETAEN